MTTEILGSRKQALEEAFFQNLEKERVEEWRRQHAHQEARESLSQASGLQDMAILSKMIDLGVSAESLAALILTPLVEVAWADGEMEEKEKAAVLNAAEKNGITRQTPSYELLESWLGTKPDAELLSTWKAYVSEITKSMSFAESTGLRLAITSKARRVAEAAGGFLGLGSKISSEEEAILRQLEEAFTSTNKPG